ncbi:hypothetical protein [Kineothrix sp. MB12-C1]|uniref:hypothetical protein n=1 Tax=Kineothrix sp. MB12-C1 TaxID=3070215 RepID=UPI0027D2529C|nr:hypothetical protein [Kineothrix sp. MB12-C1]WMC92784.1 hypothetical protein RBB56_00410 [Kineothrix sp. MB12-C1]
MQKTLKDELAGARRAGMKTVFTEYLDKKEDKISKILLQEADYYIKQFDELTKKVLVLQKY